MSDGVKIYSHIPQDRQVLVSPVPADGDATTPALFLSGKGDIARDFTAAIVESPVAGAVGLKLTPKKPEAQYDYFVVATSQPGLQIRALATRDRQGGDSVITFMNLKENQGISDKEFAFRIPKGADVITNGAGNQQILQGFRRLGRRWSACRCWRPGAPPPACERARLPNRIRTTTAPSSSTPRS